MVEAAVDPPLDELEERAPLGDRERPLVGDMAPSFSALDEVLLLGRPRPDSL